MIFIGLTVFSENAEGANAAPTNDNFASAQLISLENPQISINSNNIDATAEPGEPDHADTPSRASVWFKLTLSATSVVRIKTINSAQEVFGTQLAVYTGQSLAGLNAVGHNRFCGTGCGTQTMSSVDLVLTGGETYYIAVDSIGLGGGQFGEFTLSLEKFSAPPADNFAAAYGLDSDETQSIAGTNYNATRETGEPIHQTAAMDGKSIWYRWSPDRSFSASVELRDTFTSQMAVYTASVANPAFNQLTKVRGTLDLDGDESRQRITFFAEEGKKYWIAVQDYNDGVNQRTGNFQLQIYPNRFRYSVTLDADETHTPLSIFRPSNGTWYLRDFSNFPPVYKYFGISGDVPVLADYSGDGITDLAVTRNENGKKVWYIANNAGYYQIQWGLATDQTLVGDFDRDGRADPVAVRQNAQNALIWYVRQSTDGAMRVFYFGTSGDKPVIGDFDGDGHTDIAVTRNNGGLLTWYYLRSATNYKNWRTLQWGLGADLPATEDFDGDGQTDIAVFRQQTGEWFVLRSSDGQYLIKSLGTAGDIPQPADYDGDNRADLAFFRPSTGAWTILKSRDEQSETIYWGTSTDIPVSYPR